MQACEVNNMVALRNLSYVSIQISWGDFISPI